MNRSNIRMSVKRILKKTVALAGVVLCASSGFALQQDGDGFYMIADSSDWSDFSTLVKTMPTANVKMVSDIDLEGVERSPIGTFNGVFDGADHTISNLVVNLPTTDDVGLFSILKNATIKNLSVCGGRIEGRNRVGGIAGRVNGGTVTVTNSYSVSRLQGNYITQGGSADDDIVGSGTSGVIVQSRPTVIDCFPKNIVNLAKRGNGSGAASRLQCEMCLLCWKNRYAYQT